MENTNQTFADTVHNHRYSSIWHQQSATTSALPHLVLPEKRRLTEKSSTRSLNLLSCRLSEASQELQQPHQQQHPKQL